MNAIILLLLLTLLFVSLFVIVPKYADPNQEVIIQDWVGLGFNGLLFLIVLLQTRFQYMNVYYAIAFFAIAVGVAVSGVYWWIPKYIKKEAQTSAIKTMFTSISIAIILTNIATNAVPVTLGGRRH
jgi:hypothetical protein